MPDAPDNVVLVYLRRIDEKVDRVIDDVRDLKVRITNLEEGQTGIHRWLDRVEAWLDRIEQPLISSNRRTEVIA
jgi:hypothetical protein